MRHAFLVLAASLGAILSNSAFAEDDLRGGYSTFVHFGVELREAGRRSDPVRRRHSGTRCRLLTEGDLTMSVEAGIFLRGGWAIAASGTIPTTISNIAAGRSTGLGNLGDENVGYYSATGQYHFNMRGPISPYVGAGAGYMHVFTTTDGAVTDLDIEFGLGSGGPGRHRLPPQRAGRPLRRRQALLDLDQASGTLGPNADHRRGDGESLGASPPASASASSGLHIGETSRTIPLPCSAPRPGARFRLS